MVNACCKASTKDSNLLQCLHARVDLFLIHMHSARCNLQKKNKKCFARLSICTGFSVRLATFLFIVKYNESFSHLQGSQKGRNVNSGKWKLNKYQKKEITTLIIMETSQKSLKVVYAALLYRRLSMHYSYLFAVQVHLVLSLWKKFNVICTIDLLRNDSDLVYNR